MTANKDLENYLINKAKESVSSGDPCMAKSWLLTCGVLFPNSFRLQFERYLLAKKEKEVSAANTYLTQMVNNPEGADYPELKQEKKDMVSVIQEEDQQELKDPDKTFLHKLFLSLSPQMQYKMLMSVAKESDASWYDLCQLWLLTLRMFPSRIEEEGAKLVELVSRAETSDTSRDKIVYQRMMMFEVLPLILSSKSSASEAHADGLLVHLANLLTFFVKKCYMFPGNQENEEEDLEKKVSNVVVMITKKLGWRSDLFESEKRNEDDLDALLSRISLTFDSILKSQVKTDEGNAPIDLSASKKTKKVKSEKRSSTSYPMDPSNFPTMDPLLMRQLMFAVLVLFLRGLNRYSRESLKTSAVLIEIYSSRDSAAPSSSSKVIPAEIVSSDESVSKLKASFLSCVRCLDIILNPIFGLTHDFYMALKTIGADSSPGFLHLNKDTYLFRGDYTEFMRQNIALESEKSLKQVVQTISASLMMYDFKAVLGYSLVAADMINSMKNGEKNTKRIDDAKGDASARRLQFLSLDYGNLVDFIIEAVIISLRNLSLLSLKPPDSDIGNLVVLTQYRWPKHRETFQTCMSLLTKPLQDMPTTRSTQTVHRFVYLPFCDYVFHPDILEEFMYLASEERLSMELKPPAMTVGSKSMTTRGVNKGAKEEVKSCLVSQMKTSQIHMDDSHFINFILTLRHSMPR